MQKINIGIIGLKFGKTLIRRFASGMGSKYFNITAVCDIKKDLADALALETGAKAYYRLEDLLSDPAIKVVGLFTGPHNRANLIRQIIRSGRDVITTKPFELDPVEAYSVLAEARNMGRIVHLNSPSPVLGDDLNKIFEWVNKYDLGKPIACRCDIWTSHREKADGGWHDNSILCPAAPITRLGIYHINDMVRLFGEASQVHVIHSRLFTGRPTPDNAQLGILFKNGAIGNIFASYCVNDSDRFTNTMLINYENGTIYCVRKKGELVKLTLRTRDTAKGDITCSQSVKSSSGEYRWDVLHNALSGDLKNKIQKEADTHKYIVEGVKILHAMSRSEQSGHMEIV